MHTPTLFQSGQGSDDEANCMIQIRARLYIFAPCLLVLGTGLALHSGLTTGFLQRFALSRPLSPEINATQGQTASICGSPTQ